MNPTFAIAFDLIFVDLGGLFISIVISLNSIKVVVISIVVVTVGLGGLDLGYEKLFFVFQIEKIRDIFSIWNINIMFFIA